MRRTAHEVYTMVFGGMVGDGRLCSSAAGLRHFGLRFEGLELSQHAALLCKEFYSVSVSARRVGVKRVGSISG